MKDNWIKWNFSNDENNENQKIISKKLKVFLILLLVLFLLLINLKIIEVLSLADGKIIPQGRIKYVQHLEGGIVEEILIEEGSKVEKSEPLVILSKKKLPLSLKKLMQD